MIASLTLFVLDYLGARAKSDRPLELAGVDRQLTGSASAELLVTELAAVLSRTDGKLSSGKARDRAAGVIGHARGVERANRGDKPRLR
ncbi:MAG TPA: hypothetical protein VGF48_23090 [Thermoanaerobaculia bacterium]|jgi:hypothetical protein